MEQINCAGIILYRAQCPECNEFNMAGEKSFRCGCGNRYSESIITTRRIVGNKCNRRIIPAKLKREILCKQRNKCYWCGRDFGLKICRKKKVRVLGIHFDHKIPFSYNPDDSEKNIVAACSLCNQFKSSKMFDDESEVQEYLELRWCAEIYSGIIKFKWE